MEMTNVILWVGIAVCLVQSGLFSGLTLGLFGLSRLRLEVAAATHDKHAAEILKLRKDANLLLSTLLWGNVSVNVLLTILTDSVMTAVYAFFFATFGITFFGEIIPQAYFSRHMAGLGAWLAPIVRFYEFIFYPVAKPSAMLLDAWLGKEGIHFFQEKEIAVLLEKHILSEKSDIGTVEGRGASNFLSLDDVEVENEGEAVDPASIIQLPAPSGVPAFPKFKRNPKDPFLRQVSASGKKWVILTDPEGAPILVLNANDFLRNVLYNEEEQNALSFCHRPIVVSREGTRLGEVIRQFRVYPSHADDDVIEHDLILFWGKQKKIITGSDLLGRLLRGIAVRSAVKAPVAPSTGSNGSSERGLFRWLNLFQQPKNKKKGIYAKNKAEG